MLLLLFFSAACATLGIHQSKVWLLITFLPGFSIFSPSISNAPAAVRCAPHVADAIIYLNGVVGVRVKRRRWHSVLCLATYTIQLGWVGLEQRGPTRVLVVGHIADVVGTPTRPGTARTPHHHHHEHYMTWL